MRRIAMGCLVAGVLVVPAAWSANGEAATQKNYPMGVKAKTGQIAAVVYGKTDPFVPSRSSITPRPGDHFVAVDVEVFNLAIQPQPFSASASFKLVDSTNRSYGMAPIAGVGFDRDALHRMLPVSGAVRDNVVFEVPDAATDLRLRVIGGFGSWGVYFVLG